MNNHQIDNSYFADKDEISVLDCFAGNGYIWDRVKKISGKKIKVLRIDKKSKSAGIFLKGDNIKFLKDMDLGQFDVIDLDSYGVPYAQLKIIFQKAFCGRVFVTFIQSVYGLLPKRMLYVLGYTKAMVDKIPTLFSQNGLKKFKNYLWLNGVRKVYIRSADRKHYLYFLGKE